MKFEGYKSVAVIALEVAEATARQHFRDDLGQDESVRRALFDAWLKPAVDHALNSLAFHLRQGDLKAVFSLNGVPFNPLAEEPPASDAMWLLSPDEQTKALALLGQEPLEDQRPRFKRPVRPGPLLPVLRALPPETEIVAHGKEGLISWSHGTTAGRYADEVESIIKRQAEGYFVLGEAVQWMEDEGCGPARDWTRKLSEATMAGALPMYEPGSLGRVVYGADHSSRQVREYWEWAHVDDLNRWLDENEPRMPFRFDAVAAVPVLPTGQTVPRVPLMMANVQRVRQALTAAGFDPANLPPLPKGGKCPAKQAARAGARLNAAAFDHAWKALPKTRRTAQP